MSEDWRKTAGTPGQSRGPYVRGRSNRGAQRGPHPPSPSGSEALAMLQDLPREGRIGQQPSGMVFLDLDDAWIYNLASLLSQYGYELPPYFYPPHPVGAHITIVTTEEARDAQSPIQVEVGRRVEFKVSKARVSFPRKESYGLEARFKVWVESEELEALRRAAIHRAPPRGGFYIVVGVRRLSK